MKTTFVDLLDKYRGLVSQLAEKNGLSETGKLDLIDRLGQYAVVCLPEVLFQVLGEEEKRYLEEVKINNSNEADVVFDGLVKKFPRIKDCLTTDQSMGLLEDKLKEYIKTVFG